MRAEDDLTYQEYKDRVHDAMNLIEICGWTPRQVTDWMTEEDNELLIGTSEALWIISIGAYEVEHKAEGKIIILDMICFEYLILVFDKLVAWTGTGKTDKIKIREEVLAAVEDHRINLSKIDDEKTLQYIAGFKRYSTERVMKSLVGEFTQNEKWSVKGVLMGECWYKDCCVSEHPDNLRCGKPEVEDGSEKMRMLMQSEEVHKIISIIIG